MSERTCKKCGHIDYDIWGYVGLIGFSLLIGSLGYCLGFILKEPRLAVVSVVFGIIFMIPMWMISFHEEKEQKKNESIVKD